MDYVIDNYQTIAESAQIVPMTTRAGRQGARQELTKDEVRLQADGSRRSPPQQARAAAPRIRGGAPPLGRGRHQGAADPRGADLGPHHHGHRDRAAAGDDRLLRRRRASGTSSPASKWTPLFKPPQLRRAARSSIGTFLITFIALLVARPARAGRRDLPVRVRAAARAQDVKPMLELLAGVPTIVFGYFALTFFTPTILQDLSTWRSSIFNALAAGIIMGFMVLPTVASVSEDAMSAVPQSLREGAFGLGAVQAPGLDARRRSRRRCRASSRRSCSASRARSARR